MTSDESLIRIRKAINKDVKVIPNSDNTFVTIHKSNTEYGYISLHSDFIAPLDWHNSFYQFRRSKLRGPVFSLNQVIDKHLSSNDTLPGVLVIREYKESQVTNDIFKRFSNLTLNEKNLESFVKVFSYNFKNYKIFRRNPLFTPTAPTLVLKSGGERIIRFIYYDASGVDNDIILPIDSYKELIESYDRLILPPPIILSPTPPAHPNPPSPPAPPNPPTPPAPPNPPTPPAPPIPPTPPNQKYGYIIFFIFGIGLILIAIWSVSLAFIAMVFYLFVAFLVGQFVSDLDKSLKTNSIILTIVIGVIVISILSSIPNGCNVRDDIEWHGP